MARSPQRILIGVALALALLGIGALDPPKAPSASPRRPDIVLIVTDDQHAGTRGWMPVVKRYIERHGIRFPRAMVPTSLCCPSRASLLTGEYSHTTKVWSNIAGWVRFKRAGMQSRSIAVWLRRAGYRTGLVGKYLNAYSGTVPPPGWSAWHAFRAPNGNYYDYDLVHTNGSITRYGSDAASYSTDVLRHHALRGHPG